ncbi:MAG: hypothetical protein KTR30_18630, partial [Saprospiraceae bacterium]|nr:hypothetical protein [Saprospiraceae bacterium]
MGSYQGAMFDQLYLSSIAIDPYLALDLPDQVIRKGFPGKHLPTKRSRTMFPTTMKAILCTRYGPPEVLEYQDLPTPTPKDKEVLIKVRAATVTAGDCELRRFQITPLFWLPVRLIIGVFRPKKSMRIMGQEFAG